jgi:hypothetical protein
MAARRAYDELWTAEDTQHCVDKKGISDLDIWFKRANLVTHSCYIGEEENQGMVKKLLWGRRAMLSVPSINGDYHHMLYWDGYNVYDPSLGQTYRRLAPMVISRAILLVD